MSATVSKLGPPPPLKRANVVYGRPPLALEYFKKHNYQSNHPKSENIDRTEFKNDIQNIVVLEMAKSGHF